MSYHSSSRMANGLTRIWLANLEQWSSFSIVDGCRIVVVQCDRCFRMFEEELEEAKAKAIAGAPFVCLGCDAGAQEPVVEARVHVFDWTSAFWF